MEQFVKRNARPTAVEAARYQFGQPLDDIWRVARRGSHAAQLVEVPEWRLLLVRTGAPEDDPFYEVVADGTWLVYNPVTGNLAAWDDDEFSEAYRPADVRPAAPADDGLVDAVALAIGQSMILRTSPQEIAVAALTAAGGRPSWLSTCTRTTRMATAPSAARS